MIFSVIIIVLVAAIAFFHYTQGFFSATLSAVIAIIAATLAISYHEPVVNMLVTGPARFADEAHAMTLVALYALIYITLRLVFDKMVPGNIRLNSTADKIGAGVMGLVAAIFSTGIVAIAAQMLPFGPTIAGYARVAVSGERPVTVPMRPRDVDAAVTHELVSEEMLHVQPDTTMILPVDDFVLRTVYHLSDRGSLAGERSLRSVHPNYLQELFGQRLGVQVGAERTALNAAAAQQVEVVSLHEVEGVNQVEGELNVFRDRKLPAAVKPMPGWSMIIVRVMVRRGAADTDNIFRFSPATARLVVNGQNFYPAGTFQDGSVMLAAESDDFLFLDLSETDRGVDFVYSVPSEAVGAADSKGNRTLAAGAFFELKRMGRVDLTGMPIQRGISADPNVGVLRKINEGYQKPKS